MLWIFMVKNHFGVTSAQTSLKRANLMKKLTVKRCGYFQLRIHQGWESADMKEAV